MRKSVSSNFPELPYTVCMVLIHWGSNPNDMFLSPEQLQVSYTDLRHREELMDFVNKHGGLKESGFLELMFECPLEEEALDEEYLGLNTHCHVINDPIYGLILHNCCYSNAFMSKLGQIPKIFLVKMKRASAKEIAEHVIGPVKVILASSVRVRCAQLLNIMQRLRKALNRVEARRERKLVGKRMILVLM